VIGYSETLIKYASDTRYVGRLDAPAGTGEAGLTGPDVGSRLAVRFTLGTDGTNLSTVKFQVFGCGYTIAACAAAAELAEGQSLVQVSRLRAIDIEKVLENDLPAERAYCAELACAALQAALTSLKNGGTSVSVEQSPTAQIAADQGPRLAASDPLLRRLLAAAKTTNHEPADCRLFAGLLTVASRETSGVLTGLGLNEEALDALLELYFPGITSSELLNQDVEQDSPATPEYDTELLSLLESYLSAADRVTTAQPAGWLTRIIAARCGQPGHLWVAMGLPKRDELSAAISRHLPRLAAANDRGMRWKRFLFKRLCDLQGGVLCKAPTCGECSDYNLCFVVE